MTNLRTLTATIAGTAAVVLALSLGATSATAATSDFPPISPNGNGPSVPPIPPGSLHTPFELIHSDIVLPRCENVISESAIQVGQNYFRTTNGLPFINYGQIADPGRVFIGDGTLRAIAVAEPHRSCDWGFGPYRLSITETKISTVDYNALIARYRQLAGWNAVGATPGVAGTSADSFFVIGNQLPGQTKEWGVVSSDGWWIHVQDMNTGLTPYLVNDMVRQLLLANPARR